MKHHLIIVSIGLAILGLGFSAWGKVYWRWRPGSKHAVFNTIPEWRQVYQSNVRINGSQGHLDILGCNDTLPRVIARLKNAFTDSCPDASFRHSDSAGWGLIRTEGMVTRILALNLGAPGQTVVFVLTQSPDDYEQSLQPPKTHLLNEAPFYPGSIAQSFIEDETAAARLEISSAPARPESILSFFNSAFAQNGYHQMQAATGRGSANAGIALFQKDMSICCVLVQASPQANESVITVLHKQLRME